MKVLLMFVILKFLIISCFQSKQETAEMAGLNKKPTVLATTNVVADLLRQLLPDSVTLEVLMEAGVDPHLYQAKPSDLKKIRNADLVVYIGLKLEGRLDQVLSELQKSRPDSVLELTEKLDRAGLLKLSDDSEEYDPHMWFDVALWSSCARALERALCQKYVDLCEEVKNNSMIYLKALNELDVWLKEKVLEIQKPQRVLITSHDAFRYFGRAYGFEVRGLQGISTSSEASVADVKNLVSFIKSRKIRAVFVESSVSAKAIERLGQDAGVKIGAELFSDSLGQKNEWRMGYDTSTYVGMMKYNTSAIVESLRLKE